MFCSKCGKEITDDSKFCYSCGSTVEIKEKQDTITDTPPPVFEKENTSDTKQPEKIPHNQDDKQIVSTSFLNSYKKIGWGYGWLILLGCYSYGLSIYTKKNLHYTTLTGFIIQTLGIVVLLSIYFWFRKFLIEKKFWKGDVGSSSCLSAIISYILVAFIIGGSLDFIEGYEKRKEINQFTKDSVKQTGTITGAKWVFYGTTNLGDYFYDNNSVNNVSQNIIGVWDKVIYSKAGKDKVIEIRKNNKLPIDGYDKLDNQIFLLEVDCRNNTIMIIKTVSYNKQGETLYTFDVPRNSSIRHVKPETMEETLLKKVCNK